MDNLWQPETVREIDEIWKEGNEIQVVVERTRYTLTGPTDKLQKLGFSRSGRTKGRYQRLGSDYNISIPIETAEKLGWDIGSEIYVEILDEDLKQALIGKKLVGNEIKKGLSKLQEQVAQEIDATEDLS